MLPPPPRSTLFPYTTLFRSLEGARRGRREHRTSGCGRSVRASRSEEHTSELQSHHDLVCRLLLEKKNTHPRRHENDSGHYQSNPCHSSENPQHLRMKTTWLP